LLHVMYGVCGLFSRLILIVIMFLVAVVLHQAIL
jgi:hypothetical protein